MKKEKKISPPIFFFFFFYPSRLPFKFSFSFHHCIMRDAEVKWVKTGVPGVKPLLGVKGWVPQGQMGPLYLDPTVIFFNIFIPLITIFKHSISLSPFTFLISGSMHRMNNEHDKASPPIFCLQFQSQKSLFLTNVFFIIPMKESQWNFRDIFYNKLRVQPSHLKQFFQLLFMWSLLMRRHLFNHLLWSLFIAMTQPSIQVMFSPPSPT